MTDRLPKSNYQNGHEYEKVPKLSQSTKSRNPSKPTIGMHPSKNINLPKLDRIIVRNSGGNHKPMGYHPSYHGRDPSIDKRPQASIDVSNLLKI